MLLRAARVLAVAAAAGVAGCIYAPVDLGLGDIGKEVEVTVVESGASEKVALLKIDGEIEDSPDGSSIFALEGTVSSVRHQIELASNDPDVRAVIMRINSPGGGVTASDVIYREVVRFRQQTGKPVVALLMDTAASGGYYVAQAGDRVIAHPTTITGSIGVVAYLPDLSGLGEKIGVKVVAIKSGEMKDMGSPFRALTEKDRASFQSLIDQMYTRFVDVVVDGRKRAGLDRATVLKLADGRVYTADEAKRAKLIDDIGYFEDALRWAKDRSGLADAKVVTWVRKGFGGGRATIYSQSPIEATAATLLAHGGENVVRLEVPGVPKRPRAVLNYLWEPAAR
jgi:protease-4